MATRAEAGADRGAWVGEGGGEAVGPMCARAPHLRVHVTVAVASHGVVDVRVWMMTRHDWRVRLM